MNSLGIVLSETVAPVSLSAPSVVTTTELSLPSRWLATTEPTRCFTVFSVVFMGAVS